MTGQLPRRLRAETPFVLVLALLAASLCYLAAAPGHWRRGTGAIAATMFVAMLLRAVLPDVRAGMLVIRGRIWDVACYFVLGGLLFAAVLRLH